MTARRQDLGSECGFSLVELMVVLVVLGVLVTIGLPMFLGAQTRAQERAAQAQLRSGLAAALSYWAGGHIHGLRRQLHGGPGELRRRSRGRELGGLGGPGSARGPGGLDRDRGRQEPAPRHSCGSGAYFCAAQSTGQTDPGRGETFADVDALVKCAGGW